MLRFIFFAILILGGFSPVSAQGFGYCQNQLNQLFLIQPAPYGPGTIFVRPANFAAYPVVLAPVMHPTVMFANIDVLGNGAAIMKDGTLASVYGGQLYLLARCFNGFPPVVPAFLPPPPPPPPPIPTGFTPNEAVTETDPTGQTVSFTASSQGSMPIVISEQKAIECSNQSGGVNNADFMQCMAQGMLNPQQQAIYNCVKDNPDDKIGGGECLIRSINPDAAGAIDVIKACEDSDGNPNLDCVAQRKLSGRNLAAYKCVTEDATNVGQCLQAAGADAQTAAIASTIQQCYDAGGEASDYALCALEHGGNRDVSRAARCVKQQAESGSPSYMGAGLCYATGSLQMNAENQIALECAVSTGAQPYAFAVCAGGRLTARELTKCFTDGVGGNGCFGPNNEIVKALRGAGIDVNNLGNPNGEVVKAWNTVTNDMRNGPGPNNDIVKAANTIANDLKNGPGPNNDIKKAVCGLFHC
ncbi:MAG: hypothetical protein QM780_05090 [Hyphomicrobium sp.]|uniref:hypothetical protein n=1 Tax=Hyphomicrobium sp. TaxID=82 RepID=UPI0039E660AA